MSAAAAKRRRRQFRQGFTHRSKHPSKNGTLAGGRPIYAKMKFRSVAEAIFAERRAAAKAAAAKKKAK